LLETNTLAYFAAASMTTKIESFLGLTPKGFQDVLLLADRLHELALRHLDLADVVAPTNMGLFKFLFIDIIE
jgi:hypothetical protein